MANCFDCGQPVNVFFNEPLAWAIAMPLLRKTYLTDRRVAVRLERQLGLSLEQFAARAITLQWRDRDALCGDSHLDEIIARWVEAALSTIYPEPDDSFLKWSRVMPSHWSREERAGAAVSAYIEHWLKGDI